MGEQKKKKEVDYNLNVAGLEKFLIFGFCGQAILIPNIEEL
jgi:hypothetical protein